MYTIHTKREVSGQDLSYVIASAVEAGVYGALWLRGYDAVSDVGTVQDENGKDEEGQYIGVTLTSPKGDGVEYDEPAVNASISLQGVADAIGQINADPVSLGLNSRYNFNIDNYDASDADIVLQIVVFGKYVYA